MTRLAVETVANPNTPPRGGDALRALSRYRPRLRDRRFWLIQALVLAIALIHVIVENLGVAESPIEHVHGLYLVPISLFFVPVVYAALTYGLVGGLATAAWCTALAIPNLILFHDAPERIGELVQLAMVDAVAILAGQRVDAELRARRRAEEASAALRASEMKYRGIFESGPAAVLVLDAGGRVLEANPPAALLFQRPRDDLRRCRIAELIGETAWERIGRATADGRVEHLTLETADRRELRLEPSLTRVNTGEGSPLLQVVLRDVTTEDLRSAGLRAYAAHVLRAQEEERTRMARELHDQTVQEVVLVCRQLDVAEAEALPSSAREALDEARFTLDAVVAELRDFAQALRPPSLENLGLASALKRLLVELRDHVVVTTSLELPLGERRLPAEVELALFRIAQEALRNIEHHSHASAVRITATFDDAETRVEIADNGSGFDVTASEDFAAAGHLGLLGMRERAQAFGGRLEIRSDRAHGTAVLAIIPAAS